MKPYIVGIRFHKIGKLYHFNAAQYPDLETSDFVVVETSRGVQLGEVIQIFGEPPDDRNGGWKHILRKAAPRDLVLRQVWEYKEKEAVETCRSKLKKLRIKGVKIIAAEYTFDGKRLTFLYSTEGEESVDLSDLRNEIKDLFRRTQIAMRQIGPRDVAKLIGGVGACGMGNRCCSKFLVEFSPISIRMAKAQGVSLAPTEITGMCGRLRCCLGYEYEHYVEARKELPRERKIIKTPMGEGRVVSVSPLIKTVFVNLGEAGMKEFTLDELQGKTKEPEEPEVAEVPTVEEDQPRPQKRRNKSSRSRRDGSRKRRNRR